MMILPNPSRKVQEGEKGGAGTLLQWPCVLLTSGIMTVDGIIVLRYLRNNDQWLNP